jgi:hypothetical protein
MKIASQKLYSPSSSAGSLRTMDLETCSSDRSWHQWTGWSSLSSAAAEAAKRRCVGIFRGCSCVATPVAATSIYREDPPRVTVSRNQLGLSLSKRIRHGLVAKINDKRRSWTCEALSRISANHSCASCARAHYLTLPRHARPGPARRGERALTCVSPFLFFSTHLQVHREQPTLWVCFRLPPLARWG